MRLKTKSLQIIALTIMCICTFAMAHGQTIAKDLTVNAEARILNETNGTKVFLTIHLVNSTDHEVTVLTKNLNVGTQHSTNQMTVDVGYNSAVTYEGHTIVPSLYDLSPVTLKPNEAAFVSREVVSMRPLTPETQFVVHYRISPEWAKRFALWSGSVESKPFSGNIVKPR